MNQSASKIQFEQTSDDMNGRCEVNRLRWQCRRGMKELDVLLGIYLNNAFEQSSESDKLAFIDLLNLPDPTLIAYITGSLSPETQEQRRVIDALRRASRA